MLPREPKISIIIATYQAERDLQKCLDSIISQSYSNIETIIVDGGSTDSTVSIIKTNMPFVSRWVSERDNGIYDAMNKGVLLATGDFILFLGADDLLIIDISTIIPHLQDHKTIYYGNVEFKQSGLIYAGEFNRYKLAIKNICHQGILYPADVFKSFSYDLEYKLLADHAINIRLFGSKDYAFCYLPFVISRFNQTGVSGAMFDSDYISKRLLLIYENLGLLVYLYAGLRMVIAKYILRKNQYQIK